MEVFKLHRPLNWSQWKGSYILSTETASLQKASIFACADIAMLMDTSGPLLDDYIPPCVPVAWQLESEMSWI